MTETEMTQRSVVLIVDDDPQSLGMLYESLEQAGYSVLVALDGPTALSRLQMVSVDAVLLDAVMPGLSGFETCLQIKSNPILAHLPIIFMTGLSETQHIVQAFESGGVDYVVKPVRIEEVLARLQTHIRNAKEVRLAREAVDIAGFGVIVIDAQGRVAWQSPQAKQWLPRAVPPRQWMALMAADGPHACLPDYPELSLSNLGLVGLGETMLLIAKRDLPSGDATRLQNASLTPRESEVLSWLAKGKTNRDIADILGMSPRTVNKHLEHIFDKLGVETRTAAAAIGAHVSRE